MVPPKKHLLRHQPANAQIGLMEGNTFCTTLQPRLFTMDLNVMEHKVFYTEVCRGSSPIVFLHIYKVELQQLTSKTIRIFDFGEKETGMVKTRQNKRDYISEVGQSKGWVWKSNQFYALSF